MNSSNLHSMRPMKAWRMMREQKLYVIDVRDGVGNVGEDDNLSYKLQGAVVISGKELHNNYASLLPADVTILVYCQYGMVRSVAAVAALREHGYDAYFLEGGFSGWKRDHFPTEARI